MSRPPKRPRPHAEVPCTAVFIDGDWFIHATRQLGTTIDYSQLASSLRAIFGAGTRLSFFMSIDDSRRGHRAFAESLASAGFMLESVPLLRIGDRFMSKGIDVLLSQKAGILPSHVDRFVLASGDADFVPLLKELGLKGVSTALLALPIVTSHSLSESAMRPS